MRFIVDARHMSTFTIDAPAKQQKTLVSLLHLDKKKGKKSEEEEEENMCGRRQVAKQTIRKSMSSSE